MPIYEYKCQKCSEIFDVFQGITEPAVKSCKFCKGSVRKMMSLSSFHLKGSGWYATDYNGKKAPATDKPDAKPVAETEKSTPPPKATSEE